MRNLSMYFKFSIVNSLTFLVLFYSCSKDENIDVFEDNELIQEDDQDVIIEEEEEEEEENFENYVWNQQGDLIDVPHGISMDLNNLGDKIVLGSAEFVGTNCGSFCDGVVRVYDFKNGIWSQINGDIYGKSVTLSTDFIGHDVAINNEGNFIVASYRGTFGGAGYYITQVFQNTNNEWLQIGQDIPNSNWSEYGSSVSLNANGDVLAITYPGSVDTLIKLYRFSDNEWIQIGEDIDIYGNFCCSTVVAEVNLNSEGNLLAIGKSSGSGKVDFYEISEDGWNHINEIRDTYTGENFSSDIDLSSEGNTIILAGNTLNDCNSNSCTEPPQITIYERDGNDWSQKGQAITWDEENYLINNEQAVAINQNGKKIAIGLKRSLVGRTYIRETFVLTFQYSETENEWKQLPTIEMGNSEEVLAIDFNDNGDILSVGISEDFVGEYVKVFKLESL